MESYEGVGEEFGVESAGTGYTVADDVGIPAYVLLERGVLPPAAGE